jgi:hypothetical protein
VLGRGQVPGQNSESFDRGALAVGALAVIYSQQLPEDNDRSVKRYYVVVVELAGSCHSGV